jgi:NAD(P)-dependent dehydrogenase (short-subunit alcohol dehydrogenase family)
MTTPAQPAATPAQPTAPPKTATSPSATPQPLAGSVAIVTGAGRGLGRSIALALAGAGASIVAAARSAGQLEDLTAEIRAGGGQALAMATDVTRREDIDRLVARTVGELGRLDILVNNAGVIDFTPFTEITDEAWDRVMTTNLRGAFLAMRAAAGPMREAGGGRIINVASNFAYMGVAGYAPYSAAKAGLIALTRTAAVELARYSITVNAVAPGYFATDMNATMRADQPVLDRVLRKIPLRRMGEPDELGQLFVLLASPGSQFITGETIVVDGGQLAQ